MTARNQTPGPPTIRMAHPLAFSVFLRHIGAPVERHMRQQGLPVLCNDPNHIVPIKNAWCYFDTAARHEDDMVGWHVGRFVGDNNLNQSLLGKLESAPTLYQALKHLIKMVSTEASHLQIGILEREHDIVFYTHYPGKRETDGYMVSQAYQLEVYTDLIRHFAGENWVPSELATEAPAISQAIKSHFPGSRILTGQRMGYLTIPRRCLYMSASGKNRIPDTTGDGIIFSRNLDHVEILREILKSYLAEGYLSEKFAANIMDTSVRTLTRRLAEKGQKYGTFIDEIRFAQAKEMLQDMDIKIIDVARSVGFSDHSNFARMFRRICGLTPRQYRRVIWESSD